MPMTTLPAAPSTSSPSDFATKADALLAALPGFVSEANALETAVDADKTAAAGSASTATTQAGIATTKAGEALASANAAAASEAAAAGSASTSAGWKATSTTSMAIGTGAKSLTIQTGKQFVGGTDIKVTRTSAPTTTYVTATVDTYDSGTGALAFTVPTGGTAGSGTHTDWTVALSGVTGATGAAGTNGTGITPQAVGFTLAGGTSSKTLTVDADVTVSTLIGATGLAYLSTVTASASASMDFETTFDSTYDEYVLKLTDIVCSVNNVDVLLRMKIGGSYLSTSTYDSVAEVASSATGASAFVAIAAGTSIDLGIAPKTGDLDSMSLEIRIHRPSNTALPKTIDWDGVTSDIGAAAFSGFGAGLNRGTGALTGIRILPSAGTITSGIGRLYGIKKS